MKRIAIILGLLLTVGFAATRLFAPVPHTASPTPQETSEPVTQAPTPESPPVSFTKEEAPVAEAEPVVAKKKSHKKRRKPSAASPAEPAAIEDSVAAIEEPAASQIEVETEKTKITVSEEEVSHTNTKIKKPEAVVAQVEAPVVPVAPVEAVQEKHESEPIVAAPAAPVAPVAPVVAKKSEEPAPAEEVPDAEKPEAIEEDESELIFRPYAGYGMKYVNYKQSGAFGGGSGGVDLAGGPIFGINLRSDDWNFSGAYEKVTVRFPTDSSSTTFKDNIEFKSLTVKGGYGIFFLGAKARTAPLVRAGSGTLSWADITSVEALAGIHWEKLYAGRRKRPYLLGYELEGSVPVSASANGGPAVSKVSGFGVAAKGYAEKAITASEARQLKLGVEAGGLYETKKIQATWSTSIGTATRVIQEFALKFYLGLEF